MYATIYINDKNVVFDGKIQKNRLKELLSWNLNILPKSSKVEVFAGKNLGKLIYCNQGKFKCDKI